VHDLKEAKDADDTILFVVHDLKEAKDLKLVLRHLRSSRI